MLNWGIVPEAPPDDSAPGDETLAPSPPETEADIARCLGRASTLVLLGSVVSEAADYTTNVAVARGLGVAGLGAFGLTMRLLRMAQLVACGGVPQASQKYIAHSHALDDSGGVHLTALRTGRLSIALGAVMFGVLWFLAAPAAVGVYSRTDLVLPFRLAALAVPLLAVCANALAAPQALRDIRPLVAVSHVGVPVAFLALASGVLAWGGGLPHLVLAYVAASAMALAAALVWRRRWLPAEAAPARHPVPMRELVSFSVVVLLGSIAAHVVNWADVFVVGRIVSGEDLGLYVAASRTAGFVLFPLAALNTLFAPVIAELHARNDLDLLRGAYRMSARWTAGASLTLYGVLAIASDQLLAVFGGGGGAGAPALVILGAGYLVNAATGSVGWLLTMTGRQQVAAATNWVFAVLMVVTVALATPAYGIVGAAVCSAVAMAGTNLVRLLWVRRSLGVQPLERRYAASALIGLGLMAACRLLAAPHAGWSPPVVAAIVAYVALSGVLWRFGWAPEARYILGATPPAPQSAPPPPR